MGNPAVCYATFDPKEERQREFPMRKITSQRHERGILGCCVSLCAGCGTEVMSEGGEKRIEGKIILPGISNLREEFGLFKIKFLFILSKQIIRLIYTF